MEFGIECFACFDHLRHPGPPPASLAQSLLFLDAELPHCGPPKDSWWLSLGILEPELSRNQNALVLAVVLVELESRSTFPHTRIPRHLEAGLLGTTGYHEVNRHMA